MPVSWLLSHARTRATRAPLMCRMYSEMFAARSLWGAWEKHTASEPATVSRTYSHSQQLFCWQIPESSVKSIFSRSNAARQQSISPINISIVYAHTFGGHTRLNFQKLNRRPEVPSEIHKDASFKVKPRVWCCGTLRLDAEPDVNAQKLANVPLEWGKRAQGSKPAGRCVDGKRPSCPV